MQGLPRQEEAEAGETVEGGSRRPGPDLIIPPWSTLRAAGGQVLPKKLFCPKCLLPERDHAFKDDLEDFYNYILQNLEEEEILTYEKYKKFYKSKKISMLHFSKRKEESSKEYYEVLFGEVQSFFFSQNINSQLFSIYIILNKYGIPIEKKENVYTYTKEINAYINELNAKNQNEQNSNVGNNQKSKNDLDYEIIKKNIVNEIKDLNIDKEDYTNFINSNYNETDLYNYGNRYNPNMIYNYNRYYNDVNLKKEDLTPGEITQLDILFNKYIK